MCIPYDPAILTLEYTLEEFLHKCATNISKFMTECLQ